VIIDLRGEINATAEAEMEKAHAQATHPNPIAVLLDFEGVIISAAPASH
jgi:hypothetical protein